MARKTTFPKSAEEREEVSEQEEAQDAGRVTPVRSDERWRLLESAISQIEKRHGKGAIMRLTETPPRLQVEAIPTGAVELDIALGIGGIPRGRVTEIFGQEGSGKTTLAYHIIAEAQKLGGVAVYIDTEHALDPEYAKNVGVDLERLLLSQPDTGEQALEIADTMVRSGAVDIVVIDSVAALVPKAELEGEMGEAHVGLQARLMSQALRKLVGSIQKSRTAAVFINQVRQKIGVMYGNPETTPGGLALKFYASVRLRLSRGEAIKVGGETVGHRVEVKVVKNKLAPPFKEATVDIYFGKGISWATSLLEAGLKLGIITKSGSWLLYGDERLGQGREQAKAFLESHPELAAEIDRQVRQKAGFPSRPKTDADHKPCAIPVLRTERRGKCLAKRNAHPSGNRRKKAWQRRKRMPCGCFAIAVVQSGNCFCGCKPKGSAKRPPKASSPASKKSG
jgi:recombination protein RecA